MCDNGHTWLPGLGGVVSTVVSYARISKEEVGNKDNCEIQTAECREYAADRGWLITRAFVDNNISISRRSTKPRESFGQMFAAIKAGQIDIVVVTEPERLYRRPRELEDLIDIAEAGQPIKIADRSRRKKLAHAREGRPSGGTRPFGFAPDLVSIRADEAALIRQAADRLVAGDALRASVAGWNRAGITTPTARPWAHHTLKRLLLSPRIQGLRQHQGAILGPALWPAILDGEQAELVARLLTSPDRASRSRFTGRSYLLTSILECGACHARLYGGMQ